MHASWMKATERERERERERVREFEQYARFMDGWWQGTERERERERTKSWGRKAYNERVFLVGNTSFLSLSLSLSL